MHKRQAMDEKVVKIQKSDFDRNITHISSAIINE